MLYREAYNYLSSFTDYEKAPGLDAALENDGLERVRLLMRLLGKPQNSFKSVIVGGTNGKGSVSAMLDSALRQAGHNTGLFTSPHLHTFRERIRVGGEMISPDDVATHVGQIKPIVERISRLGDPTLVPSTYELAVAVAFLYFQERGVELAILEVGLGGRLDAVNVCESLVSALTSISLDHTEALGNTVREIAGEKVGIIKQGGVVVTAPQPAEARKVIERVAAEKNASLTTVGREIYISTDHLPEIMADEDGVPVYQTFSVSLDVGAEAGTDAPENTLRIRLPLLGNHQQINAAVAVAVLSALVSLGMHIPQEAVIQGLRGVRWPGRLEIVHRNPTVVVDGAHNVASMSKLNQALAELFHQRPIVVVLGVSSGKDTGGIVEALGKWAGSILGLLIKKVIVTRSEHPRAADPDDIAEQVAAQDLPVEVAPSAEEALKKAEETADGLEESEYGGPVILVTGSLFLVAEARRHYGLAPDLSEEG